MSMLNSARMSPVKLESSRQPLTSAPLTVVLILKGRPTFTRRWLAYAKAYLNYPILVADGSSDEDSAGTAVLCRELAASGFAVEYVRYPYDANLSLFYSKLADAIGRVRTPYVALADNDDFFWPESLAACVEFLESNPDHVACGGRMVGFTVDDESQGRLYGRRVAFHSPAVSFSSLRQKSAAERVRAHFARYHPTWYDVQRVEVLKKAVETLRVADPTNVFLVELWTSFLAAAAGPIGHLPRAYLFRQRDTPTSAAADDSARGGYLERSLAPTWEREAATLCADIADAVSARDGLPREAAQALVCACFDAYTAAAIASENKSRLSERPRARLKAALSQSPLGRAALRPLKTAAAAARRFRARPVSIEDRPAAQAVRAFLASPEKI